MPELYANKQYAELIDEDLKFYNANKIVNSRTAQQVLNYPDLPAEPQITDPQIDYAFQKAVSDLLGIMRNIINQYGGVQMTVPINAPFILQMTQAYSTFATLYNTYISPLIQKNPIFKRDVYNKLDEIANLSKIILDNCILHDRLRPVFESIFRHTLNRQITNISGYTAEYEGIKVGERPSQVREVPQPEEFEDYAGLSGRLLSKEFRLLLDKMNKSLLKINKDITEEKDIEANIDRLARKEGQIQQAIDNITMSGTNTGISEDALYPTRQVLRQFLVRIDDMRQRIREALARKEGKRQQSLSEALSEEGERRISRQRPRVIQTPESGEVVGRPVDRRVLDRALLEEQARRGEAFDEEDEWIPSQQASQYSPSTVDTPFYTPAETPEFERRPTPPIRSFSTVRALPSQQASTTSLLPSIQQRQQQQQPQRPRTAPARPPAKGSGKKRRRLFS